MNTWGIFLLLIAVGIYLALEIIQSRLELLRQIETLRKFVDGLGEMHGEQQVEIREQLRTMQATLAYMQSRLNKLDK